MLNTRNFKIWHLNPWGKMKGRKPRIRKGKESADFALILFVRCRFRYDGRKWKPIGELRRKERTEVLYADKSEKGRTDLLCKAGISEKGKNRLFPAVVLIILHRDGKVNRFCPVLSSALEWVKKAVFLPIKRKTVEDGNRKPLPPERIYKRTFKK